MMPYIGPIREALDDGIAIPQTRGELTYVITKAIDLWITKEGVCFDTLSEAIEILDEAKQFDRLPPEGDVGRWIADQISSYMVRAKNRTNGMAPVTRRQLKSVLECAKLELYRRVVAPYEQQKLELNGDVYTCPL